MTAPAPSETRALTSGEIDDILQELIERGVKPSEPRHASLSALTLANATEAIAALSELQSASIRLTFAEDWVLFRAKDGAETCYLQDAGCERVRSLWGIDFGRVSLKNDVIGTDLEDGNYTVEVIVSGKCNLTNETIEEMGFRSSAGFFGPEWEKWQKAESPVEIARMKSNVRKAAMANGRGRCVRTITGLSQVPVAKLVQCGLDPKRIRGVRFESGTKGGSGDYASDPQLKKLTFEALKRVVGLDAIGDYSVIHGILSGANLTKIRASQLIEGFAGMNDESKPIDIATFEKQTGAKFARPAPGPVAEKGAD